MTLAIGARKDGGWQPVAWHPYYEQIVLESCYGLSNIEIGRKYGLTKVHVCNILRTNEAEAVRQRVLAEIRSGSKFTIEERLSAMADKAIQRVEQLLDNDELAIDKPLAVADRAMRFLEGKSILKNRGDGATINNNILNMPSGVIDRFTAALEASTIAKTMGGSNDPGKGTGSTGEPKGAPADTPKPPVLLREVNGTSVEVGVRQEHGALIRQAV